MPFGLSNAPATFQELMNCITAVLKRKPKVQALLKRGAPIEPYIDDVLLGTKVKCCLFRVVVLPPPPPPPAAGCGSRCCAVSCVLLCGGVVRGVVCFACCLVLYCAALASFWSLRRQGIWANSHTLQTLATHAAGLYGTTVVVLACLATTPCRKSAWQPLYASPTLITPWHTGFSDKKTQ